MAGSKGHDIGASSFVRLQRLKYGFHGGYTGSIKATG
jgi:hypothetical protein